MDEDNHSSLYRNVILLMMRAKRHLAKLCEVRGITPMQGMVLLMFEENSSKSMNELSCCMGCDASNVTGLIERLEGSGLIERSLDPQDRRVKMIGLSKKGRVVRQELLLGLQNAETLDLKKLSQEDRAQFLTTITKLTAKQHLI